MIKYCSLCDELTNFYRDDQIWNGNLIETYFCCECGKQANL